jgi:amino acid transporter
MAPRSGRIKFGVTRTLWLLILTFLLASSFLASGFAFSSGFWLLASGLDSTWLWACSHWLSDTLTQHSHPAMEQALAILLLIFFIWIAFRVARVFLRVVLLVVIAALGVAAYFFFF